MTDALRDVVRHGTAVGSVGARINFPAGGKTGTTNDGYDVWFIGFTPDMVTGHLDRVRSAARRSRPTRRAACWLHRRGAP